MTAEQFVLLFAENLALLKRLNDDRAESDYSNGYLTVLIDVRYHMASLIRDTLGNEAATAFHEATVKGS